MALQAERVDVVPGKQACIGRAVRKMARGAALKLERRMLVNKRACGLSVALHADGILIGARLEQIVLEGAMGIVAVGAFHQPFRNAVMKWLRKRRLNVRVALKAEARLLHLEQECLCFELVHAVATGAADAGVSVGCTFEVGVVTGVAAQALFVNFPRSGLGELKYFGRNPAAFDMGLAGSVAAFAGHSFAAVLECQLVMRIVGEAFHLALVADGAAICSGIA